MGFSWPTCFDRILRSIRVLIEAVLVTALQFAAVLLAPLDAPLASAEETIAPAAAEIQFLKEFCFQCHAGDEPQAEISLEILAQADSPQKNRSLWTRVQNVVARGEMPPADEPQPSASEAESFIESVRRTREASDRNAKPDPGRVTMRRLNRAEYRNTIRDLVGIDFDPTEDFPSDDIGYGFDNIGDVLTLAPVLMERYLDAAEKIMSRAILPEPPPVPKRHLDAQYTEPASGEVASKWIENGFRRLESDTTDPLGLGPLHTPYKWEADGAYTFRTRLYGVAPEGQEVHVAILLHGPGLSDPSPESELATVAGNILRPARLLKTVVIRGRTPESTDEIEVSIPPAVDRQRVLVGLVRPSEGQGPVKIYVRHMALEGPLDTRPPSQRVLLAVTPGTTTEQQTREVLARFLRRAYRRPVEEGELQRLIALASRAQGAGEKWEGSIQLAMQAALCSPKFLFRVETDEQPENPAARLVDPLQLASRLSYFLWSSMPDDQLLDLAAQGKLHERLDEQVLRMLADPRSDALVENFAFQWLQIKRLESFVPDAQRFPQFDPPLRAAMLRETELFFASILREDRSVLDLLRADYTFLNQRLAQHYGIPSSEGQPITGEEFRRVSLAGNSLRGGLLTQASILAVTSNPTRTSPVKRGRWVLEQILGAPPPPPPPNVPELSEEPDAVTAASLRERMEIHRRNPACASCHTKMDAIGFALENYDAVGAYREQDGEFAIDARGEFPDGTTFTGAAELRQILLGREEDFLRALTEKLLIYALGRGLEYYDRPTIDRIVSKAKIEEPKFSVLVREIVRSDPFLQRRGTPAEANQGARGAE